MTTLTKRIIILLVFLGLIAALRFSGVSGYLTIDSVRENRLMIEGFVTSRYALSVSLFIAIYIVSTAFSVPGATVLTLAGGFFFGVLPATVYVNVGATIGATLAFLMSRYVAGNWLQARYHDQLARFNAEIGEHGHLYLLFVRLIPAFPFFLVNLFSGLTRIPLKTFIWTTTIGILPADLAYSFAGSQLGSISSPRDIVSGRIGLAFLFLALLAIFPVAYKKLQARPKH
jgi:uncharacterized membrane protein YdjX (TVP38/TMEM64 family)